MEEKDRKNLDRRDFIKILGAGTIAIASYGCSFGKNADKAPAVYFTKNITPASLMAVYKLLGRDLKGKVAVKVSTGEAGNNHYLAPALIKDLVQSR